MKCCCVVAQILIVLVSVGSLQHFCQQVNPTVGYCGCRNQGPLCCEPRAVEVLIPGRGHSTAVHTLTAVWNFFLLLVFTF